MGDDGDTEDIWAQCDKCDKWRKFPPGLARPEDGVAWDCSLNPDTTRNTCDVPEEEWKSTAPLIPLGTSNAYATALAKAREQQLKLGQRRQQQAAPGAAQQAQPTTLPKFFPSPLEELQNINAALQRLLDQAGVWDLSPPPGSPPHAPFTLPVWLWNGLAHFSPEAADVALKAVDLLTALGAMPRPHELQQQQVLTFARLALLTAACSAHAPLQNALAVAAAQTQPAGGGAGGRGRGVGRGRGRGRSGYGRSGMTTRSGAAYS